MDPREPWPEEGFALCETCAGEGFLHSSRYCLECGGAGQYPLTPEAAERWVTKVAPQRPRLRRPEERRRDYFPVLAVAMISAVVLLLIAAFAILKAA